MLGVRSAVGCSLFSCSPLAVAAFQHALGQCKKQVLQFLILPEPEIRNGLSLARNDDFRHHYEVNAPDLRLHFRVRNLRKPVRSKAPSLGSVFETVPGEFNATGPLPAPISATLVTFADLHSPSGSFEAFRIKAFNRFHHQKLAWPDVWSSLAPRRALFRCRCGSTLETPLPSCRLSFRKPWN